MIKTIEPLYMYGDRIVKRVEGSVVSQIPFPHPHAGQEMMTMFGCQKIPENATQMVPVWFVTDYFTGEKLRCRVDRLSVWIEGQVSGDFSDEELDDTNKKGSLPNKGGWYDSDGNAYF